MFCLYLKKYRFCPQSVSVHQGKVLFFTALKHNRFFTSSSLRITATSMPQPCSHSSMSYSVVRLSWIYPMSHSHWSLCVCISRSSEFLLAAECQGEPWLNNSFAQLHFTHNAVRKLLKWPLLPVRARPWAFNWCFSPPVMRAIDWLKNTELQPTPHTHSDTHRST